MDYKELMKVRDRKLAKVMATLRERGIVMKIGGCGCCSSPWVSLTIDGVEIFKEEDDLTFDMFDGDELISQASTNPPTPAS